MKKDIIIPKVEGVQIVAIQEWNDDFQEHSWYAYLLNETDQKLEMAIVVSRAYGLINGENRKTGTFRHAFKEVEPKSAVKVEFLENNVLQLNNEFMLSYFLEGKLYDKKFIFKTNSINEKAQTDLPVIGRRGVLAV
ncbi:hypothetical protein NHF50_06350 [Flavobacterium sp. NRK F10]|uniref:Phenylalanyl-tRNA synthetase subunit alpha n=1 Tax=Flavobacterium sediminis TaxID=2201181 RepID=A0A2U8QTX7_9FLAO|nr:MULTISPECIES: hypothetical protein [Flavobacterium]AWM13539.1 hypothetical protein DI487_06480 [Flavobacterium sediminis]MCO6174661.1 hypothetical protein [Flavobacterium sp. NRK F10]